MATQSQYTAAAAAAFTVLKAEVNAEVPLFFRSDITDAMLQTLANAAAKAAVDAAEKITSPPPQPQEPSS